MLSTEFGPVGNSVVLSLTQSSQTFALGTLPADGPALRLQSLNSGQTAWYIKFGTSGAVTVSVTDGMRVVPGGQDAPVIVPVPTGSTHYAILCEGAAGDVLASYGGYDEATFSPIGASQVVAVTTTDQRIALPALGTISPAIRLVATSPGILALWVKLGDNTVTGSVTTSMKVSPGSVEDPTIIPVTSGQTHLSIFCEGVDGSVVLSPGQVDHSLPFPLSRSGDRWGVMPYVASDGVMEIGKFIDFHLTDGDTTDFAIRLDAADGSDLFVTPAVGGSAGVFKRVLSVQNSALAQGDIVYWNGGSWAILAAGTSGQVLRTQGAAANPQWSGGIVARTAQATTSGATKDFASIPAGVNRITVVFNGVSLSGTDNLLVQLGDSGGIENTGYVSTSGQTVSGASGDVNNSTAGFIMNMGNAARLFSGHMLLTRIDGNTWISSHAGKAETTRAVSGGGDKTLSATLDTVRIAASGANTFDAGSANIFYEF